MRENCVEHKARRVVAVLREGYYRITGEKVAAAILGVFEYWANGIISKTPDAPIESIDVGERDIASIEEMLLWLATDKQIRERLSTLEGLGFITSRNEGKFRMSKSYHFNVQAIQTSLNTVDWSVSLREFKSKITKLKTCGRKVSSSKQTKTKDDKDKGSGQITDKGSGQITDKGSGQITDTYRSNNRHLSVKQPTTLYIYKEVKEIEKNEVSVNPLRSQEEDSAAADIFDTENKTEFLDKTENLELRSDIPAPPLKVITATDWMLKKFEEMKLEDVDIVPKVLLTEKRMRNYKMPWEVVAFDSKYLSYDSGFIDNWAHDWADSKKCPEKWAEYIPQVTATVSNHSQTVGGLKKLIARYAGYQEKLAGRQKVEEEARQIRESVVLEPMALPTGQRGAAPLPKDNFHWRSQIKKWAPDEKEVYDICTDEQKNAQAAVWLQGNGYKAENIEEYI